MKNIYVLNINNYFPELISITYPLIEKYCKKIGANFIEIKERKFENYPITYEKLQIYELGKDSDWNIYIDSDVLINPILPDITFGANKNNVIIKDGFKADLKFPINSYLLRDGRNFGVSGCLIGASDICHDIWRPVEISSNEMIDNIKISKENLERGLTREHYSDEYAFTMNLARFGLKCVGLNKYTQNLIYHPYDYKNKEDKLEDIKKVLHGWNTL